MKNEKLVFDTNFSFIAGNKFKFFFQFISIK